MNNIVLLNCIGYSLGQCYDSNIEILKPINNDDDLLDTLKKLAAKYKEIASKMSSEELDKVSWSFSTYFIRDILNAKSIEEIYPKK